METLNEQEELTEQCAFCKNEIEEGEESALFGHELSLVCTKCIDKLGETVVECPGCAVFRIRLPEMCECSLCGTLC